MGTKLEEMTPWVVFTSPSKRIAAFAALLAISGIEHVMRIHKDEAGYPSTTSFGFVEGDRRAAEVLLHLTDAVSVESPSFLSIVVSKDAIATQEAAQDGIKIGIEAARERNRFDNIT